MSRKFDPVQLYIEIGKRVRRYRESIKMRQDELAKRIGVTRTSVTNLESGIQRTPIHHLYEIANVLDVDVADLLPPYNAAEVPPIDGVMVDGKLVAIDQDKQRLIRRLLGNTDTPEER